MSNKNPKQALHFVVALGPVFVLLGCNEPSRLSEAGSAAPTQFALAGAQAPVQSRVRANTLAYEHTVSIETTAELLPARMREIERACNEDAASGCSVLEASLHSRDELPSGTIRMRLARAAVEPTIEIAAKDGKVIERSTRSEDLAEPVADTERQLALMTMHRDRLTEVLKSKDIKIDQLIVVSKELATVQSQIDSLNTQHANLRRRIDTELLTIRMLLPQRAYAASRSPVADALREFGADFRDAVGTVIRFIAMLLPWLVVILPGLFLLRLFWRWIGKRLART